MPRATLGGGGLIPPTVAQYEDWVLDYAKANNGGAANLQSGALTNVNVLVGPDGRPSASTGTGASNGVNVNAVVDDGNGRVAISLGGGLTSGGVVNGGAFGWNNQVGCTPQLIKPTTSIPVSLIPLEMQAWLYDFWVQWGPLGGSPNRGDCGISFEMGNGTVPDVNCIHNVNLSAGNGTGAALGFGLFLFADGFLHFFSNTGGTNSTPGVNDTYQSPPTDIARVSFLFQSATLTTNATLSVYINKVLLNTYTWTLGAGHKLPLWTDTGGANHASFQPQVIAAPPGQDAQAFKTSGILLYGMRMRKGPLSYIFTQFASS